MSTTTKLLSFILFIMLLLGSSSATPKPKEFTVGDTLFFDGPNFDNNIIQVSSLKEYDFCNSSKAIYNLGSELITFTKPGLHYFISSDYNQCLKGYKLEVLVVHDPLPKQVKIYRINGNSNGWIVPESNDYLYREEKPSIVNKKTGNDQLRFTDNKFECFRSSKTGESCVLKVRVGVVPM